MRIGVHVRMGQGHAQAVEYATRLGCTAIQIFSSNPRSYRTAPIDTEALIGFRAERRAAGIDPCVIHTPYLINLASDEPRISYGSLRLLEHDLAVAGLGEMRFVNTHLGSYGKRDRNEGFTAIVRALETVLDGIAPNVMLVMENSAGAGNLAGGTIDELARLIRAVDHPQLGVCLDTAHAWAAGYEINCQAGVNAFIDEALEKIGTERLPMFHFNDTEVPLGAGRDRHWHIGQGLIGEAGFLALLSRKELHEKTAILETPGEEADDVRNLAMIHALAKAAGTAL